MGYITKKLKVSIFSSIIFLLLLTACNTHISNNITDKDTSSEYANVYITIVPNIKTLSTSRAAVPQLPDELIYTFEATSTNTSTITTSSTDSASHPDGSGFDSNQYMLRLPAGTWTITATGYTDVITQPKLRGSIENLVVSENGYYEEVIPVYFIQNEDETGSCNLEIETTGTNISYLKIAGMTHSQDSYNITTVDGKQIIKIEENNIPAKTYYPTFTFYNDDDAIVTIIAGEAINIRQNVCTNKWYKTNKTPYLNYVDDDNNTTGESGEATFVLTQNIIDSLSSSTIYLSGSGNDSNDGSYYSRYATLSAALKRVNELNNINYAVNQADNTIERKSFYIYCSGSITETSSIDFEPDNDLNLTITPVSEGSTPVTATINLGDSNKFSIKGSKTNSYTINNLNITGDISLENENGKLKLENVENYGKLAYSYGQLILGGKIFVRDYIIFKTEDKKILVDSALSSPEGSTTVIKPENSVNYEEGAIILEGTENHQNITSYDYNIFSYYDFNYAVRLKTIDGITKAVLQNTPGTVGTLPIHDDIGFVLVSGDSELTGIPPYDFQIQGYSGSTDGISGTITIKMYVKVGDEKFKVQETGDSISLSLFDSSLTHQSLSSNTQPDENSNEYTEVTLTVSNIKPGVYPLKMSVIIEGIPYSKQVPITASFGDG